MAKCENCYHAGACGNYPNTGLPPKMRQELLDKGCKNFKDKSLIVELPCKFGDDLYWISDENEVKCQKNAIVGIVVKDNGFEVLDTDGNIDKIGTRYAYLTREEAERALEECEKADG